MAMRPTGGPRAGAGGVSAGGATAAETVPVAGTGPTAGVAGVPVGEHRAVPTEMGVASSISAPLIADPAPLGLAAFGITTLMLSCINAGWIGGKNSDLLVLSLAIPFGGAAQALAGMWAFRRGNTFAATAFTSYGAFWISFYLLVNFFAGQSIAAGDNANSVHSVVGLYLLGWGIFTAYMFIASLMSARAVTLVFALLTLTFFALAIGEWTVPSDGTVATWHHIGGWLGVATAVAALYASFADVTNANFKRTVLPTFEPGARMGRRAV